MLAMTSDSPRFAAGISHAGVTDMLLQTENQPMAWRLYNHQWTRFTGDLATPGVKEQLASISPINKLGNISRPIAMSHGLDDEIVDVLQTKRFVELARKNRMAVKTRYFKKEGHILSSWQSRIVFWRFVEKFLADCIGGGASRPNIIELAARFIYLR